ncbi:hypothetical protein NITHO_3910003 [Nitrolancea hollandica Lb]|uniref:Uncharacterized protein n=1 Tax=Nitrolancea hollandica Lb TaxID=1129897 RepID=I4EJA8_9BACT|nr:hypothetical protein NITHO_3910003 [Nitrolancea hollandica Lb]
MWNVLRTPCPPNQNHDCPASRSLFRELTPDTERLAVSNAMPETDVIPLCPYQLERPLWTTLPVRMTIAISVTLPV